MRLVQEMANSADSSADSDADRSKSMCEYGPIEFTVTKVTINLSIICQ